MMMVRIKKSLQTAKRNSAPRNAGFTLIELLVVIAIIALLMGILMPALSKARKLARSAVCKAHLRQWGTVIYMYTADNNGLFWEDGPMPDGHVVWLPMLADLYGNVDDFRLCPSAAKSNSPPGIGNTVKQWDVWIYAGNGFIDEEQRNYGSYGTNLWINSVEKTKGGRGQPKRQWKTVMAARHPAQVPMVADCTWFGTNPVTLNDGQSPNGGKPTPTRDWWETKDPSAFGDWDWDMARVCLDRHGRGVNMVLMDGSSRKVFLQNLWSLKWHKEFKLIDEVDIPWLN